MDLIWTLIIGGVVGWLASILMRTNNQMGILANVVVGIIGSFLGQYLARASGVSIAGSAGWWITAVIGASLLILVLRGLGVFGRLSSAGRY